MLLIAWLVFVFPYQLHKVKDFRGVKIENHCPGFFWIEGDLKKKNISKPAAFFLMFISDKVPPEADGLDDIKHLGKTTKTIINKGGHLWSSGDGKVAGVYGINLVRGIKEWKLDASLIVVTDGKGKILALYKNAEIGDIDKVIRELRL
jgi:hypothetical protein